MHEAESTRISEHFAGLSDPRQSMNREHKLMDLVVITICAVISGADDWVSIAEYGEAKEEWLTTFLELPGGIPAHDTFWRVFRQLDAAVFQECFLSWIGAIQIDTEHEIIAIDGKQLRGSHDAPAGKAAIHIVSAWAVTNGLVLGQRKVDAKSNEITAIPELLDALEIKGATVTIDAMGCQTEIAQRILDKDADYLLALKGNHPQLYEDVTLLFDDLAASSYTAYAYDHSKQVDKDHGRIEVRQAWVITDLTLIQALRTTRQWPQLLALIKVQSERYLDTEKTCHTRYFISSAQASAADFLRRVRAHWTVENNLHWCLDIAFREDDCRLRKDHGPQNFAILRHIALNLLKQNKSTKIGIKNKRLKAGWDHKFLLNVLKPLIHTP